MWVIGLARSRANTTRLASVLHPPRRVPDDQPIEDEAEDDQKAVVRRRVGQPDEVEKDQEHRGDDAT